MLFSVLTKSDKILIIVTVAILQYIGALVALFKLINSGVAARSKKRFVLLNLYILLVPFIGWLSYFILRATKRPVPYEQKTFITPAQETVTTPTQDSDDPFDSAQTEQTLESTDSDTGDLQE